MRTTEDTQAFDRIRLIIERGVNLFPNDEIVRGMKFRIGQNWTVDEEFPAFLRFLYDRKPHHFLEIGTDMGFSFFCFSQICSGKKISVDQPDRAWEDSRNERLHATCENSYFLHADSHLEATVAAVEEVLSYVPGSRHFIPVDFLFIDGDHSFEGSKRDFEMYLKVVAPDGVIAFHDINDSENHRAHNCYVSKTWEWIKETYPGRTREFNAHHDWAGIGVLELG